METFSIRLNKLIKETNTTMYKIAKELKISKSTVSNWCYNFTEPKATDILKIALFFDVSADYLLGLEDANGTKTHIAITNNNNTNINFNNNKF